MNARNFWGHVSQGPASECWEWTACRAANTAAYHARKHRAWDGLVPAKAARRHLAKLSARGVGRRSVAEVSGVAKSIVCAVATGRKRTIRASTERRILDVGIGARADGALVDARDTHSRVRRMLGWGLSKAEIARRLGRQVPALQLGRSKVTARNELAVLKLVRAVEADRSRPEICRDCAFRSQCSAEGRFAHTPRCLLKALEAAA